MSGYTDNGVIDQGMLAADTPFIQKPFTSATLEPESSRSVGWVNAYAHDSNQKGIMRR